MERGCGWNIQLLDIQTHSVFLDNTLAGIPIFDSVECLACLVARRTATVSRSSQTPSQPLHVPILDFDIPMADTIDKQTDLHSSTTPCCTNKPPISSFLFFTTPDADTTAPADPVTLGTPPTVLDEHMAALVMVIVLMVVIVELVKMTLRSVT